MFPRIKAPIYKNTGSTARDHLAAERTFLTWLRTGLGFVALGIAVERFSQFDTDALRPYPTSTFPKIAQLRKEVEKTPNEGYKRDRATTNLVLGLLGMGSGVVLYGVGRYFLNMRMLEKGLFKPSFAGVGGLGVAVVGLTGMAYAGISKGEGR